MKNTLYVTKKIPVEAKYLKVVAGVRYWDDATVNGEVDTYGTLIPFRVKDTWCPIIDIEQGTVLHWPSDVTCTIHYKVCDEGVYTLLDKDLNAIVELDGYVPSIMSPAGDGYGDYIIMNIDNTGKIENWRVYLKEFQAELDVESK